MGGLHRENSVSDVRCFPWLQASTENLGNTASVMRGLLNPLQKAPVFLIPSTLMWDLVWKQSVWRGDGMWSSVRVQLTLVLTRRRNVGTEVATNKQGIRRRTGRYSKVAGAWGRPSVHLGLTDIRVENRDWAGRNCFVPSLRGHQPCLHRG